MEVSPFQNSARKKMIANLEDHELSTKLLWSILFLLAVSVVRMVGRKCKTFALTKYAQQKRGCALPARYPHKFWSGGRDLIAARQAANLTGGQWAHYDKIFTRLGDTWEEYSPGRRLVNTQDHDNIRHILTLDNEDFVRGPYHRSPLLGPGITSSDGPRWKFSRELIKPFFAKSEVGDTKVFDKHLDRFMSLLPTDGSTLDIQPLVKKLFLDSSTDFIFGTSTESLLTGSDELVEAFNYAITGVQRRRYAGFFAVEYWFDRRFNESIKVVHDFVDRNVQRILSAEEQPQETQERSILLNELANIIKDPVALRHEVLNVFSPSRDTSAIMLSNALFRLARRPGLWQELRRTALTMEDLDVVTLNSAKLFRFVFLETLRMTGPSGRVVRMAARNTTIPRGGGPDQKSPVFLEAGDHVSMFIWGLHHNPAIWGNDSYEFKPQRFDNIRLQRWQFLPFSGGRRTCPANELAIIEATRVLVRMVRRFERIENRDDMLDFVEIHKMLGESRNGVKIGLVCASDEERC